MNEKRFERFVELCPQFGGVNKSTDDEEWGELACWLAPEMAEEIIRLRAELAALKERTQSVCRWRMEDDDSGLWAGDCGAMWTLTGGSPEENEMAYCPQCGRKLEQVEPEPPEDA